MKQPRSMITTYLVIDSVCITSQMQFAFRIMYDIHKYILLVVNKHWTTFYCNIPVLDNGLTSLTSITPFKTFTIAHSIKTPHYFHRPLNWNITLRFGKSLLHSSGDTTKTKKHILAKRYKPHQTNRERYQKLTFPKNLRGHEAYTYQYKV
jgi:hypothetical protein